MPCRALPLVVVVLLAACSRRDPAGAPPTPAASTANVVVVDAAVASTPPPDAAVPVATPATPASGTATLVLQKVSSDCGGVGSWGGSGERLHLLGTDVFVRLEDDDPKAKPRKEFAFCASHDAAGKARAPQLQIWQNCSAFSSCQVGPADPTGSEVDVTCGKEHIVVKSDATHTVLRGSFGERELAPHPMKIAPVKTETRRALVDC